MQSKPENFIQMITLLDKMVLPTDMKIGIEMCYKDIQDEQTWVHTLEQYRLGKIDKATALNYALRPSELEARLRKQI